MGGQREVEVKYEKKSLTHSKPLEWPDQNNVASKKIRQICFRRKERSSCIPVWDLF